MSRVRPKKRFQPRRCKKSPRYRRCVDSSTVGERGCRRNVQVLPPIRKKISLTRRRVLSQIRGSGPRKVAKRINERPKRIKNQPKRQRQTRLKCGEISMKSILVKRVAHKCNTEPTKPLANRVIRVRFGNIKIKVYDQSEPPEDFKTIPSRLLRLL